MDRPVRLVAAAALSSAALLMAGCSNGGDAVKSSTSSADPVSSVSVSGFPNPRSYPSYVPLSTMASSASTSASTDSAASSAAVASSGPSVPAEASLADTSTPAPSSPADTGLPDLAAAAVSAAHRPGFALPAGMVSVGVTAAGLLVTGQDGKYAAFDRAGHRVWTATPATNQAGTPIVDGNQLYLLGKADVPASGLTAAASVTALVSFDTSKPDPKPVTIAPKRGLPADATPNSASYSDAVKWVFEGAAYLRSPDTATGTDVYTKLTLATGATSVLPAGPPQSQVLGVDAKGGLITFAPAGTYKNGEVDGTLTSRNWPAPIPITAVNSSAGLGLTPMDTAGRIVYTVAPATPNPDGSGPDLAAAVTKVLDRNGKTTLSTKGFAPTVWSPNGKWAAGGDGIVNTAAGGKSWTYPAKGATVAANFFAVDNDGAALTLGADHSSAVQINPTTKTVKTLPDQGYSTGVQQKVFGGWLLLDNPTGALTPTAVPPAQK